MTELFTSSSMSRRRFLANSAMVAGSLAGTGAVLDACSTASSSPEVTTITVLYNLGEVTLPMIAAFEKLHPEIKVKFIDISNDPLRFSAMLAAGTPPDFVRTLGGAEMPNIIARGLARNLSSYFSQSSVFKADDLQPIYDVYRYDGKVQGKGPLYGAVKDWSQDATLWYNKKLFDQAHVPYPSETEPMTYDALLDMAKRLTVNQNGKIQVYGLDANWGYVMQGHVLQMVAQQGGSVFNSDFTKADFTTPEATKAIKWYVDWAQAHVGPSPLDPYAGWDGTSFPADRLAISMFGYWFGGSIVAPDTHNLGEHVGFAPAPVMGSTRVSSCMTGTGAWIPQTAKHPDEAWKFMEYFMGGQPAKDRATGGFGIPGLKSLFSDLPQAKPYQAQAYKTQKNELQYQQVLHFSPYVSDNAVNLAFSQNIEPVMKGKVPLDQGITNLNNAVNLLLQQGKSQLS